MAKVDPVTVRTVVLETDQIPVSVTAVGTTEPFARTTLGTRLVGRVSEVRAREGDTVVEGQVLVRVEDRDLTAKREQARSAVREAEAVLANAETTVGRMRNLFRDGAVSRQQLDEAETGLSRAKAGVSAAEAALAEVEANVGYSSVKAPMAGVVTAKFVDPGDMAAPGAPLLAVERQDPMQVTVQVSEQDLVYVRMKATVETEIEAVNGRGLFQSRVETVVPSADPGSRTFAVKVLVDNPDGRIRSGMFARVRLPKGSRAGLLVPSATIVREGQLEGVYVLRDGVARLRWVRLGRAYGERVEVVSGLSAGDRVVISPARSLRDGHPVRAGGDG